MVLSTMERNKLTAIRDRGQTSTSLGDLTQMTLSSSSYAETRIHTDELAEYVTMTDNIKVFWSFVAADNEARQKEWEEWVQILMPAAPLEEPHAESVAMASHFDFEYPRIWRLVPTQEEADAEDEEDGDDDEGQQEVHKRRAVLTSQLSISSRITDA